MQEPFKIFDQWYQEALKKCPEPTAMALATVGEDGIPSNRMVLLKDFDESGFVFYTNLTSTKGKELAQSPGAALCFHWLEMEKQVRIRGPVVQVSDEEADEYFASRPKQSQIGAWASKQSQEMEGKLDLEKRVAKYALKFNIGKIPRPKFWSGFRVIPTTIEFWQKKPFRLHQRQIFKREDANSDWTSGYHFP